MEKKKKKKAIGPGTYGDTDDGKETARVFIYTPIAFNIGNRVPTKQ
jgi:hypothetical protein